MKYTVIILLVAVFLFDYGLSLKCYDCYIDGPKPYDLLTPKGPVWQRCNGEEEHDVVDCNGVCIELMLYGNDIEKYQILRSCAYGEEICDNIEFDPEVHIGKCETCDEDKCNDNLQ